MVSTVILQIFWWVLLLSGASGSAQAPARVATHSPHGSLALPCENCHTFTAWKPVRNLPEFDHNKTRFPLRGLHAGVSCRQCHSSLVFSDVGAKCADCHADIHRRQLGAQCEQCHTVKGWRVSLSAVKQHQNRFPLVGALASLDCDTCHKGAATGQFQGLPTDCAVCHFGAFERTTAPNHRAANFSTTCQDCHSMNTWFDVRFDHLKFSGFALTGAHAKLDCTACHVGGRFQNTPAHCYGCHAKDYAAVKNPDHVRAGFPTQCSQCHSTSSWAGARFDHNTFTSFPLTGAHVNVPCTQCHVNGRFAGTPKTCASCHLSDFQKTTNPNHVAAGFPQDCSICHATASWAGARFDHSRTQFPLTGAHTSLSCVSCHGNGQFAGLSTTCVSCHLNNYNSTTNPNYKAAGFPQDCAVCHATTAWTPASFDHNKTGFPLTGAHTKVPCASCHIGGRYAGTPTDCYSCHRQDYTSVANPNHVAAGFPTNCAQCHTTATWLGATFNHTWFPIYSGTHAGKWTTCGDCHGNPSNFAVFSCITCHAHDKAAMDQKHSNVGNYVYNSANCYACHPTGRSN